jgi:hypothetical protein
VTDETIYIVLGREIKIGVLPTVTCVASGTPGPIALYPDAKIVDLILFANGNRFRMPVYHDWLTLPSPVDGLGDLMGSIFMTSKTGNCNLRTRTIRTLHEIGMIRMRFANRYIVPGVVRSTCIPGDK